VNKNGIKTIDMFYMFVQTNFTCQPRTAADRKYTKIILNKILSESSDLAHQFIS